MTRRGLFLGDGTSDSPLARVLERIAAGHGHDLLITSVDPTRYPGVGKRIDERLAVIPELGEFQVVFVHRDAESDDPDHRRREIADAVDTIGLTCPVIPVVPVRMTEAWLLLDEGAIRAVAGKPGGRQPLDLPSRKEVERLADPKRCLEDALLTASGTSGRRRDQFRRDLGRHRGVLLERLDPDGPVSTLSSWQRLVADVGSMLGDRDRP